MFVPTIYFSYHKTITNAIKKAMKLYKLLCDYFDIEIREARCNSCGGTTEAIYDYLGRLVDEGNSGYNRWSDTYYGDKSFAVVLIPKSPPAREAL